MKAYLLLKYSLLNLRYFSLIRSNLQKALSRAVGKQMSADKKEED